MNLRPPDVDVVIPARHAAESLERTVRSVQEQDYPNIVQIAVGVGPSDDATRAAAERLAASDPRVAVVRAPTGRTPDALNAAVAAGSGTVLVRVDAHATLPPGYVRRSVTLLEETGAVNVGGMQRAVGETPFERAVAAAMNSPLGAGDARFRVGGPPGPTDTVYLGVFRRDAVERVGGFDPSLERNQDYELNWRLRQEGGTVYFHPDLEVAYRPRGSLRALARQYFDYGRWKRVVLRRHPSSTRWRQLAPPAVLAANATGVALMAVTPWAAVVPVGYVAAITLGAVVTSPDRSPGVLLRLPLILATIHHAWAVGFCLSPARAGGLGRPNPMASGSKPTGSSGH